MTPSQELAPTTPADLTPEAEAELARQATADYGGDRVTLPLLSLTQDTSKVVKSGKREAGRFINTLTGKDYGEEVELIICYLAKGRFHSDRDAGETYVAFGDVVPSNWPDKWAGKRFDELPDAEETYRVQHEDEDWGKGPPIQTTRNFVGFIPDDPKMPLRLSLKSTSTPAARKIKAIMDWSQSAPWYNVIEVGRRHTTNKRDEDFYVVTAEQGRETTAEERQAGISMFQQIKEAIGSLELVGEAEAAEQSTADRKAEADAKAPDALPVD